jgi:transcriptional regulator with XRE-family HTH domain
MRWWPMSRRRMQPPAEPGDQEGDGPASRHVETTEKAISRAVGEELRRARDAKGWTRGQLVARLPSGIGDRTLLSYEHGTRHLTLLRFVEVCGVLGEAAPQLLDRALHRARVQLENLVLRVDVRQVAAQRDERFLALTQWARNKLVRDPSGVVKLAPSAVVELADFIGCSNVELARYLTRFAAEETDDGHTLTMAHAELLS